MSSEKFHMIVNKNDQQVSAEFVSAVDEIVFEESYTFLKLLNNSGIFFYFLYNTSFL